MFQSLLSPTHGKRQGSKNLSSGSRAVQESGHRGHCQVPIKPRLHRETINIDFSERFYPPSFHFHISLSPVRAQLAEAGRPFPAHCTSGQVVPEFWGAEPPEQFQQPFTHLRPRVLDLLCDFAILSPHREGEAFSFNINLPSVDSGCF